MLKALLERNARLLAQMETLSKAAEAEDRDLTDDEGSQYDALKAEMTALEPRIARARTLQEAQADAGASLGAIARNHPGAIATGGKKEFETMAEFLHAVRFRPNDQRLAYVDRSAVDMSAEQRMDSGPAGGFAIPTQFRNELMRVPEQGAIFRPRARVIPAGSPPDAAITMMSLDQDGTTTGTSARGGVKVTWIGEGGQKPVTDTKLRQITLEPKEVAATMEATDKLLRNWQAAGSLIESLMRDAITAAEEDAFLNGNGVAKPLGVLNSTAAITIARGASGVTYNNLTDMLSKLLMRGGNPVWSLSQSELPKIMKITDPQGGYVWQPNARDGVPQTLFGYSMQINEFNPQADAAGSISLLNLDYYLIKDGSGPFVASSEHVKFDQNKTMFKIFWNVDGQPWLKLPFIQEKGFQVSPFVLLGAFP